MRTEDIEVNHKPKNTSILYKILPVLTLLLIQLKSVAAFSFYDDMIRPMWDSISGTIGPIVVIIIVVVGFGKASTIEGIPTGIKVIIFFVCFGLSIALASSIQAWGVGNQFRSFFGNFKFW
jgi:hypothetical protein